MMITATMTMMTMRFVILFICSRDSPRAVRHLEIHVKRRFENRRAFSARMAAATQATYIKIKATMHETQTLEAT